MKITMPNNDNDNPKHYSEEDIEKFIEEAPFEDLIEKASDTLDVDIDWLRTITKEEVLYLLNHCPFLQITNTEMSLDDKEFKLIESHSGWDIHDYGDALSSSPGKFLYGGGYFRIHVDGEEDEGGSGIVNPGKGTIVKQAFDTAFDMIEIAKANGWAGVHIVDGHPLMKRAAWIKGQELGIKIENFEPNKQDEKVFSLLKLSDDDLDLLRHQIRLQK